MSIQFSNSNLERRVDKAIKQMTYKPDKKQLVEDAVNSYLEQLYHTKTIKYKV